MSTQPTTSCEQIAASYRNMLVGMHHLNRASGTLCSDGSYDSSQAHKSTAKQAQRGTADLLTVKY